MMYDYIPTATDKALAIYTNALIDQRHAVNLVERQRLLARASRAWAAFVRCDNPFPGWKLPKAPCSKIEDEMDKE